MKLPTRKKGEGLGFNMTPMIDVVFLLIIFFLVSSHLSRQEIQSPLDLPTAATGHDDADDARPRVTVNVLADGQTQLAGENVEAGQLVRRLQAEVQRRGEDLEVRIRADRSVPYRAVEPILIACSQARLWNVTFAVLRKD